MIYVCIKNQLAKDRICQRTKWVSSKYTYVCTYIHTKKGIFGKRNEKNKENRSRKKKVSSSVFLSLNEKQGLLW